MNNKEGRIEIVEVRGNSLEPIIHPGQTMTLQYDYYKNNQIKRDDIVAYQYAGNEVPIIKIVKAITGDVWQIKQNGLESNFFIVVNGISLKNSEGKEYKIPEERIKMLKLYVESYPTIPQSTYLLLGNQVSGSLDGTRFGLAHKSDILGKMELVH